jgi:sugar phosphate isomerase/epimerase
MSYSFVGFACVDNLSMAYRHEIMEIILYSAFTFVVSRAFDPSHTREGRFRSFGNQSEQCLPRLGKVHLHDGPRPGPDQQIGYGKDHQPLGKGDLGAARLIDRLEEANFDGPMVFELTVEDALHSLEVINNLRPGAVSVTTS